MVRRRVSKLKSWEDVLRHSPDVSHDVLFLMFLTRIHGNRIERFIIRTRDKLNRRLPSERKKFKKGI